MSHNTTFIKRYKIVRFSDLPTGVNFRYCGDWFVKHSKYQAVNLRTTFTHTLYTNRFVGITEYSIRNELPSS